MSIVPTCYTLRYSRGFNQGSAPRYWKFQVSKDGNVWTTLYNHENDTALNEEGSTATWPLECPEEKLGYRFIKIQQVGPNSNGNSHRLSLSGFEIYGTVTGVFDDISKSAKDFDQSKKQKRLARTNVCTKFL